MFVCLKCSYCVSLNFKTTNNTVLRADALGVGTVHVYAAFSCAPELLDSHGDGIKDEGEEGGDG